MSDRDTLVEEIRLTLAAYGRGDITEQQANAVVALLSEALREAERKK